MCIWLVLHIVSVLLAYLNTVFHYHIVSVSFPFCKVYCCVLFSAVLAHLHTRVCTDNTQIKHSVPLVCGFYVLFPSFNIIKEIFNVRKSAVLLVSQNEKKHTHSEMIHCMVYKCYVYDLQIT